MNAMPAYVGWLDSAGLKWVGGFRDNVSHGLPFITSLTLLIDPRTGRFLSVMDGALITSLRTGAQAAVPLRRLYGGHRIRIGLYGAGAQGRRDPNSPKSSTLRR
jgi:ornithine cyclodeaminase/alanine dehydrogenase